MSVITAKMIADW